MTLIRFAVAMPLLATGSVTGCGPLFNLGAIVAGSNLRHHRESS